MATRLCFLGVGTLANVAAPQCAKLSARTSMSASRLLEAPARMPRSRRCSSCTASRYAS